MAMVGWALEGTFRVPLGGAVFWLVEPPAITSPGNRSLHEALEQWHGLLAWPLTMLIAVHVAAALYHLWIKRDGAMQRMWFQRTSSHQVHAPEQLS
jgi:cytochrome b561